MNSFIDQPRRAELHLDSITRLVTHFYDGARADALLGPTLEGVLGNAAGFDVIAWETRHGGR